jgi:hypothetical protein
MDKTQTMNVAYDCIKFIAIVFCMSSICSYDHEIMQLTDTGGVHCVYQMLQHNWVTIKVLYRYLRGCLLSWHGSRLGFVNPYDKRYLRAHSVIQHHNELACNVTNELVMGSCITERVKRLVGNEIELGMVIPTIESRAINIPIDKGNCIRD